MPIFGQYGHNGRCITLWTLLPLNGMQEVGGFPKGTTVGRESSRPDQTALVPLSIK